MEDLNFDPAKSTSQFRRNYKLHDLAEYNGKNLLTQWGIKFADFGEDKRYQKVWEKGNDKPDLIINYKEKECLIDWKGKHKADWIANKRAIESYINWKEKFGMPVFICFAVFDNENILVEIKFASIGVHKFEEAKKRQWDKNEIVRFEKDLPDFTKVNLLKFINFLNNNSR